MATPNGTVAFEAGGKAYQLRFGIAALCALEERAGKSALAVAAELDFDPHITTVRAMFWAALNDADATIAKVNEIMDELGTKRATAIAREALAAAFPDDEGDKKEGAARPLDGAAG